MTQDIIILFLVVALGLTWVVGWRGHRRLSTEIDELVRDRVEHTELQGSVGRTLGQLQMAADELAEALATRTGRLHELLTQADTQASTLGEAIAVAQSMAQRVASDVAALRAQVGSVQGWIDASLSPVVVGSGHKNGAGNGSSHDRRADWTTVAPRQGSAYPVTVVMVADDHAYDAGAIDQPAQVADLVSEPEGAPASPAEVKRLAREGLDLATIARRTNRGREEVRLLLQFGAGGGRGDRPGRR